jgi:hypothetical protein
MCVLVFDGVQFFYMYLLCYLYEKFLLKINYYESRLYISSSLIPIHGWRNYADCSIFSTVIYSLFLRCIRFIATETILFLVYFFSFF